VLNGSVLAINSSSDLHSRLQAKHITKKGDASSECRPSSFISASVPQQEEYPQLTQELQPPLRLSEILPQTGQEV